MQEGRNMGFRVRATATLDQVAQSKTLRNLLLVSFGIGFAGLAAHIGAAAFDEYQVRADSWDRAYSSSFGLDQGSAESVSVSPLLLPAEPVDTPAPDVDLELAVTTNDPALVIAGAAKSVLREDGKRYRVTVTVESTPNESNERKL
jgi:hypothetical protein